jgi:hypothetical protein
MFIIYEIRDGDGCIYKIIYNILIVLSVILDNILYSLNKKPNGRAPCVI